VDGLAFASLRIIEAFNDARVPLSIFDISGDTRTAAYHFKDPVYHLKRVWRTCHAALGILFSPREFKWVYMPVNSGAGAIYNLVLAAFARLRGKRIILHHHSFRYVDSESSLIARLLRTCGDDAVQIVLCGCMRRKLESLYGRMRLSYELPSDYYSTLRAEHALKLTSENGPVILGHLSNLTLEKGVDDCIALHRALVARGDAVTLVIGGPCSSPAAKRVLDEAVAEFPQSLVYMGALDEAAKEQFYRRINVFLFPTRYRNEADPIVVSDAQSYGLPTIVTDRGCLGERVDGSVGMVISQDENFVGTVLERIPSELALRDFARTCGPAAKMRHLSLRAKAIEEFSELCALLDASESINYRFPQSQQDK